MGSLSIGWWFLILILGIIIIVFCGKYILKLVNLFWRILLQIIIGFIILFFFNIFGQLINLYLPLNFFTAGIVGILRIPGLIFLILLKILFI